MVNIGAGFGRPRLVLVFFPASHHRVENHLNNSKALKEKAMSVDTISSPGGMTPQPPKAAEAIDSGRKNKESALDPQAAVDDQKIQPEELLDQIKSLTQDGLYSVRFEKDEKISDLVIKIFDNETQEVIRQIPAEELLNFKANFAELVGNLVNTKA